MCVVGAIIGAAVIGAAGTAIAGSDAASATQDATNASINQQQSALNQESALSAPYRNLGQSAIPTLQGLLGIGAPATPAAGAAPPNGYDPSSGFQLGPNGSITPLIPGGGTMTGQQGMSPSGQPTGPADPTAALRETPGYRFTLNEGLNATKNAASASGMLLSGNTLRGLDQFSTGLADQTYQQTVGNLENVAGIGQAAAAGQAANIGNSANNISNALINQGTNIANIDANTIAGITKAVGGGVNDYITYNTLQSLLQG